MARFNAKTPSPAKGRVCLFVNPDTYRKLKSECVLRGTNVSLWFDDQAAKFLEANRLYEWDSKNHRASRKVYKGKRANIDVRDIELAMSRFRAAGVNMAGKGFRVPQV